MYLRSIRLFWFVAIGILIPNIFLAPVQAANIYTVGGGGVGDGGPAVDAQISSPSGMAPDQSGNLYIVDRLNHRIRKIDAATGTITTLAGNGTSGFSGDNGLSVKAQLNIPYGVVSDQEGNLYVSDRSNNVVRRMDRLTAEISTIVGNGAAGFSGDGGPGPQASLNGPTGLALDVGGELYITDTNNNRIRMLDLATGVINTVAGGGNGGPGDGGPAPSAQLYSPQGIVLDEAGNLYIADSGSHRIRRVEKATGTISTIAGTGTAGYSGDDGTATAAQLNSPSGVAYAGGILYIADTNNDRIRKVMSGIISTAAGGGTLPGDGGNALDARLAHPVGVYAVGDNLYIADTNQGRIHRVDLATGVISTVAGNGTLYYAGEGIQAIQARLYSPGGMVFNRAGDLYLADRANHRIRKVDKVSGVITTVAGTGTGGFAGDGEAATQARMNTPYDMVFDVAGNLYFTDQGNHRVRKVEVATGVITTIAGTGTAGLSGDGGSATQARLNNPSGLAIDASGNFYIADRINHRIRKIDMATGIITTVAGSTPAGFGGSYSGDGGPATQATLNRPLGVSVDTAGDLMIADTENHRIRKVDAATGVIITVAGGGSPNLDDGNLATNVALTAPPDVLADVMTDPSVSFFYIADPATQRVRKVDAGGIISTVAGSRGVAGFSGDGGVATSALLNSPVALAIDGNGDLFIADSQNNRIRKISTVNQPPLFYTRENLTLNEGITKAIQVWTGGPEEADIISLDATALPSFATITDNGDGTGIVVVSPGKNSAGSYSGINLVASDGTRSASHPLIITVTVPSVSVSLSSSVWDIGVVQAGQTLQMTETDDITITNDGPVAESFTLRLSDPPGWTAGNTAGQDIYVMKGLFVRSGDSMSMPPGDVPSDTDFEADDVITNTPRTASPAIFGYAGGSMAGTGVLPWNSVDLWLQFTSPAGTGIYGSQQIEVTVGAIPN